MKKKDLVLDFTSLLDVIMIILFVVITSVGQTSIDAKEELKEAKAEKTSIQKELQKEEDAGLKLKEEAKALMVKLEELKKEKEDLDKENRLLKAMRDKTASDTKELYESLMKKSKKFTLVCLPFKNASQSGKEEVEIKLYSGENGGEQEVLSSVIFEHDFSLSSEERSFKNRRMQEELYKAFDRHIKDSDTELLIFTVQYTYGDKSFSQSDLDMIDGAIKELERRRNKTCFIDRVKQ